MTRQRAWEHAYELWDKGLSSSGQNFGPNFKAYYPLSLNAPSISWAIYSGRQLTSEVISNFEANFRNLRPTAPEVYVSMKRNFSADESNMMKGLGYSEATPLMMCFTTQKISAGSLSDLKVAAGSFEDAQVFEDYSALTCELFGLPDRELPEFNRKFVELLRAESRILNFRAEDRLVATCGLIVIDNYCWLFGGSVIPAYRNRGLWRILMRARQEASEQLGARIWFLQTEHHYLAKKFEIVGSLNTYKRSLSPASKATAYS